ncbi:MAG: flavin reductase [Bacteroidales bacterium]|jgi:flavin reductase (DIM6/NTAB) family NADH-FMN oxidoreductase RutF|nr:flavin reductase [Bacteroidales bacterium]
MKKTTICQILLAIAIVIIIVLVVLKPLCCCKNSEESAPKTATTTEIINDREWKKIDPKEIQDNPVQLIADDWLALAAGKESDLNAMTIAWGTMGNLWGKPVVTVFVSPDRYTYEFMERNEYFTVTAFPETERDKLQYIGSHSGRDGDKIKDAGLTVEYTDLGNPTFTDGRLMIECRKIYTEQFDSTRFNDETKARYRNGMGVHHYYIGEIVNVWVK